MSKTLKYHVCDSCEAVHINGVLCHEHGCPDAWKDTKRECKWCGSAFIPDDRFQQFCDDSCYRAYNGMEDTEVQNEQESRKKSY